MEYLQYAIDFVLHIDVHMAELVAQYGMWIYAILFVIIFCETGLVCLLYTSDAADEL